MKSGSGSLTIHRRSAAAIDDDGVVILSLTADNGVRVIEIKLEPDAFVTALFSGLAPALFEFNQTGPITAKKKVGEILVPRLTGHVKEEDRYEVARKHIALHLPAGWIPRWHDLFNIHRWADGPNGESLTRISIVRFEEDNEEDRA